MADVEVKRTMVSAEDAEALARACALAREAWTQTGLEAAFAAQGSFARLAEFVSSAERRRPEYRGVFDAFTEGYLWPIVAGNPVTRRLFRGLSRTESLAADVRAENSWRQACQAFTALAERTASPRLSGALAWVGRAMGSHADTIAVRMRGRDLWTPETASMALVRLDVSLYKALREPGVDRERAVELFDRAVGLLEDELAQDGVDVGEVVAEKERIVAWGVSSPEAAGPIFSRLYSASVAGARPDVAVLENQVGTASAAWGGSFAFADGEGTSGYASEVRAPMMDALSLSAAMARAQLDCVGDVDAADGAAWMRATYLTSDVVSAGPDGKRRSTAVYLASKDPAFARALSDERALSAMGTDDGLSKGGVKWAARRALLATLMVASTTPAAADEKSWGELVSRIPKGPLADASGSRSVFEVFETRRSDGIAAAFSAAVDSEAGSVGPRAMARALLSRGWTVEDVLAASSAAASALDLHSKEHTVGEDGVLARFASSKDVAAELALSGVVGNPLERAAVLVSAPGSVTLERSAGSVIEVDAAQRSVELDR